MKITLVLLVAIIAGLSATACSPKEPSNTASKASSSISAGAQNTINNDSAQQQAEKIKPDNAPEMRDGLCTKAMTEICATKSYDAPDCASRNECITPTCVKWEATKNITHSQCVGYYKVICPANSNVFYCLANPLPGGGPCVVNCHH